ncbi:MAG: hypothetical protein DMF97_00085 [Acidobacteria bacterium]|nr:MAG: hypothetical protein DMF97_00085 [Acidobacteriota bacterium]
MEQERGVADPRHQSRNPVSQDSRVSTGTGVTAGPPRAGIRRLTRDAGRSSFSRIRGRPHDRGSSVYGAGVRRGGSRRRSRHARPVPAARHHELRPPDHPALLLDARIGHESAPAAAVRQLDDVGRVCGALRVPAAGRDERDVDRRRRGRLESVHVQDRAALDDPPDALQHGLDGDHGQSGGHRVYVARRRTAVAGARVRGSGEAAPRRHPHAFRLRHDPHGDRDRRLDEAVDPARLDRKLPVERARLLRRRGGCGCGCNHRAQRRLLDGASGGCAAVLHLSHLQGVHGPHSRPAAARAAGLGSAPGHDRSARARPKDQTAQSHVRRVQVYAAGLARAFGMTENEIQGVKTAALLHDIGKLAVPEHILSKPGPLTHEEFQKIRIHPQVGAEIISGVPFPYPVAPLILSHHERYDGKGYPSGLKGDEIPIGARILSVVDYFDALVSERPYHKAMTVEAALGLLQQEAGKALDPRVVQMFSDMYPSLAAEAEASQEPSRQLTRAPSHTPEAAPAAGLVHDSVRTNVFHDIALAHREIYALYEIAQAMGSSLAVSDTMALISSKLSNIVPFSCCALFLYHEETDTLRCRYATGTESDTIQAMHIKSGDGLTGWVARNRRPLVNARPSTDFDAAGVPSDATTLQSALVCPLMFNERFIGTISVYHTGTSVYTDDHRRLLDRISEQAAAVIYNSMVFEQTQEDSLTDPLTSLPNTRYMFMHLTRELARAERLNSEVALMVMDLDNFKDINDTYGHHVGDRALRDVADVLRGAIRPYDMCVRYAGDEFIVVLSGCGAEEAELKRAELQHAVDDMPFAARAGTTLQLGVSIGASVFPHDGNSYETLIATADGRMYRDKTGRKAHGEALAVKA